MRLGINGRFLAQPLTGVQRYARCWVQALDRLLTTGEDLGLIPPVILYVPRFPGLETVVATLSLTTIQTQIVGLTRGHFWEQLELPWYSRGLVLVNLGNTAPLLSLWGAQKTVVTVHDLSFQRFPQSYTRFYRWVYRLLTPAIMAQANVIFTVSETEAQAIQAAYPQAEPRLVAIPNGHWPDDLDLDLIPPHNPIDESFMLAVGTLSERKNLRGIIQATILLNQKLLKTDQVHLVIVGGRPGIYQALNLELSDSAQNLLHWVGTVDDPTLISYYKAAQGLVYPSFDEASGLPPLEAMACGCPVIVSDIPALRERCGTAAVYCQPDSLESIAEAMFQITLCGQRQIYRLRGTKRAAEFSWQQTVTQALAILRDHLNSA